MGLTTEDDKEDTQTPLLKFMAERAKERQKKLREAAKQKKKEREERRRNMDVIDEDGWDSKKWKCADCGSKKKLEEDPESGKYYCSRCWKAWDPGPSKKKKKKKDKKEDWDEESEWKEEKPEREKRSKKNRKEKSEPEWRAKKKDDEW